MKGAGMKHREMREFTRQAIMDAFWALYRERPIEKISVKEDLLDFARVKLTEELPASLARNFPEIRLDAEALRPLSDLYTEKGEYLSVLLGENGDPSFQYKYKRAAKNILLNMLDDPAKKFDVSASIVSEFTASAIIGAFNCWYPRRDEYPAEKYAALLLSLLSGGSIAAIQML